MLFSSALEPKPWLRLKVVVLYIIYKLNRSLEGDVKKIRVQGMREFSQIFYPVVLVDQGSFYLVFYTQCL